MKVGVWTRSLDTFNPYASVTESVKSMKLFKGVESCLWALLLLVDRGYSLPADSLLKKRAQPAALSVAETAPIPTEPLTWGDFNVIHTTDVQ